MKYVTSILLTLLAALLIAQAAFSLQWPIAHDAAPLLYESLLMQNGAIPYKDFFDFQMPGSFIAYYALGTLSNFGPFRLRILDLLILTAILTITYFAMRRFGKMAAFTAIILFGLKYLQGGPSLSLQREYLILIFISLSIWIGVTDSQTFNKRLMLGLLYGFSATLKPHAALGLLPFLLFDIADLRKRRELSLSSLAKQIILPAAIGFIIPIAAIIMWLAFTGALTPFLSIALNYWKLYSQINGEMAITPSAQRTAYLLNQFWRLGGSALWLIPAGFGIYINRNRQAYLLGSLALCYAIYPALSGQFFPYHYIPFVYTILLVSSLSLSTINFQPSTSLSFLLPLASTILLVTIIITLRPSQTFLRQLEDRDIATATDRAAQISTFLEKNLEPGDKVQPLDWTGGSLLAMLENRASIATPYVFDFYFYHHVSNPYIQSLRSDFINQLTETKPRFIIEITAIDKPWVSGEDTTRDFPALRIFLDKYYSVTMEREDYIIYELATDNSRRPRLHMKRLSILYLIIPFFLFLFGWVRLTIAIPLALILLFALYKLLAHNHNSLISTKHWTLSTVYWLLVTAFWLLLSGIGGYMFQNWDHNWRNVVLRDLINFNWPVYYAQPTSGPVKMLVYYVGFWLPSAFVGKLFNWQAANFFLFAWTLLGILLVTYHLGNFFKTSTFKATLLLIFFSGLDILGTLFFAKDYPTLLPPITHLETWAGSLQYSSFTTQLFWVFNQAVPAWLCIILIVTLSKETLRSAQSDTRARLILLWSLCFFFAPLASVGLFPYILIELIKQTNFKSPFRNFRWEVLLSSSIVFLLSAFFFTTNTAAQSRGFQSIPFINFLIFLLLEGGILWLMLAPSRYRDPRWMVTGALLVIIPFIQLGSDRDFVMRASIAPLFYLMLMTGETIFQKSLSRTMKIALYTLLILGALTPIYEINRSIYRTFDYYFIQQDCACDFSSDPITKLAQPNAPEEEHPGALTADALPTLQFMTDELSQNFIANVRQTFFYKYLASR